ncbi:MAG: 3-oxoacyl-ACP synthase [Jejuia sp.]
MSIKQNLYNQCHDFIENRLQTIQSTIQDIQKSLLSETKSSAGDKHETGRAMLQLEREKAENQLAEIQKVKETLSKIDIDKSSEIASIGSLVYTSKLNYFISISAGELKYKDDIFYAISPSTPIAKLLLAKKVEDEITFRSLTFTITKIS